MIQLSLPMKIAIIIAILLVAMELGIRKWRSEVPQAEGAVWTMDLSGTDAEAFDSSNPAMKLYKADRGYQFRERTDGGLLLDSFLFEWDSVEMGPLSDFAGHTPEECNVAAGFEFLGQEEDRELIIGEDLQLTVDVTRFKGPGGDEMLVYKAAWAQGRGSWGIRQGEDRWPRLTRAFQRGRGAARVIEFGVRDFKSEEAAWTAVRDLTTSRIQIKEPS